MMDERKRVRQINVTDQEWELAARAAREDGITQWEWWRQAGHTKLECDKGEEWIRQAIKEAT